MRPCRKSGGRMASSGLLSMYVAIMVSMPKLRALQRKYYECLAAHKDKLPAKLYGACCLADMTASMFKNDNKCKHVMLSIVDNSFRVICNGYGMLEAEACFLNEFGRPLDHNEVCPNGGCTMSLSS